MHERVGERRVGNVVENTAEGDAACWLDRVCDECGAINESPDTVACWRCGSCAQAGRE